MAAIGKELNRIMAPEEWNIDLSSPDKVLTVTADVKADDVLQRVAAAGFKASVIG